MKNFIFNTRNTSNRRNTLNKYYEEVRWLKLYKQALDEILRQKDHVLSAEREYLLLKWEK